MPDGQAVLPLYVPGGGIRAGHREGSAPERSDRAARPRPPRYDYSERVSRPQKIADWRASDVDEGAQRAPLIEAIIADSEDESLLDRYLAGEHLESDVLIDDLDTSVARGTFYPVIPVCAGTELGLTELLEVLEGGVPVPGELDPPASDLDGSPGPDITCDPDGLWRRGRSHLRRPLPWTAVADQAVLRTLRPDTAVHISGHGAEARGHPDHDADEKVSQSIHRWVRPRPIEHASPVTSRYWEARERRDRRHDLVQAPPLVIVPWAMPNRCCRSPSSNDAQRRGRAGQGPRAAHRGDPTVRIDRHAGHRSTGAVVPGRGPRGRRARPLAGDRCPVESCR